MKYDQLYDEVGQIGLYQWLIFGCVFVFTMVLVDAIHSNFIGGSMAHWCRVDELASLPNDVQKYVAIPTYDGNDGSGDNDVMLYMSCRMFELNHSAYNETEFTSWNRSSMVDAHTPVVDCQQWSYDQSTFTSTVVKKFDLVCEKEYLNALTTTLYMIGVFCGAFSSGVVSDRFGRRTAMFCYSCIKVCGNLLSIFAPHFALFVVGRIVTGFGVIGVFLPGYVLVMEMVGPKYRNGLSCAIQIAFAVGFMLQAGIAYSLRDEFSYQLAATGPSFIFPVVIARYLRHLNFLPEHIVTSLLSGSSSVLYCCCCCSLLLPESTRWLIVHGRYDQAMKQLHRMCSINRVQLPVGFDPRLIEQQQTSSTQICRGAALLTSPVLRIRTLIIDFSWFTCSLIYYALSLNVGSLPGDIYFNTFVSGAVEVPAYLICFFIIDWKFTGRHLTGCLSLIAGGLSGLVCIPLIIFDYDVATTTVSMIGKFFICISYSVVFVHASELFPTEVRSVAMGTGNMCSRLATMPAKFLGGPLMKVWQPLPTLIYGVTATVAGLAYAFLPETLGQPLSDTVKQAERAAEQGRVDKQMASKNINVEVNDDEDRRKGSVTVF